MQSAFPSAVDFGVERSEETERFRWGWRILLTLLLLAMLALFGLLSARSQVQAAPAQQSTADPLVLAFYYSWFDEATWTYDKLSDLPTAPYVSRDRGVMARHIEQAQAAGIDGFLVAWYGPWGEFNQTEPNLAALLDEAAARNFRIGILFETDSPFLGDPGDVTAALQHATATHFNHPAYLRADGRPVVFFWRPHIYGVDTWAGIRSQVDPGYGSLWISEGVDTAYLRVFDGHHLYSNTWNPPADLSGVNQKFAGLVSAAGGQYGATKLWVATVMPGYNDVRIRPGAGFATDREGGAYYARAWQAAIDANPQWIVITSFNEWPEGTYIEPSAAFGDQYLQLTREWSSRFKSGRGGVQAAALAPPAVLPAAAPLPEATTPTAIVTTALLNLRAAPTLESAIVGQVAGGAALGITAKDADQPVWWQVDYQGDPAWVFGDLIQTAGSLDDIPVIDIPVIDAPAPGAAAPPASVTLSPLPAARRVMRQPVLSRQP